MGVVRLKRRGARIHARTLTIKEKSGTQLPQRRRYGEKQQRSNGWPSAE